MRTTKGKSACVSTQSDQRLCCSLPRQDNISSFYLRNFKPIAILCSWAGLFEAYLVTNPEDRFSRKRAHRTLEETSDKSPDSDQTGQMPFAGRTCHFVGFVMRQLVNAWRKVPFLSFIVDEESGAYIYYTPPSQARSDAHLPGMRMVASSILGSGNILSLRLVMIIVGQLSVIGEGMCST